MFSQPRPFLIAGPCSAESREQVLETAAAVKESGAHLFRAGVWKPRSRPGNFEGRGAEALEWLKEVKETYGLPVTTEVAEPAHIEAALTANIDVLWIGARTTVNPFDVQRLADALRGVQIPVMVKNPVSPDVDLWEGALERFEKSGIAEVAAIHRGFAMYQAASPYRNAPHWPIPIELRRRRPHLPIFCDPSHIAGRQSLVADVAQKGMDMDLNGLMIEVHPNPAAACSDAAQQLTPAAYQELLQGLIIRQDQSPEVNATELEYLRQLMDSVDAEIIDLLARRTELARRIGFVKKSAGMTAYQPERWREIVATRGAQAISRQLPEELVLELFQKIHHQSILMQLGILEA